MVVGCANCENFLDRLLTLNKFFPFNVLMSVFLFCFLLSLDTHGQCSRADDSESFHLYNEKYATARFRVGNAPKTPLALPSLDSDKKRILYTTYEYEPLLHSSNMTMDDWVNIAKDLRVIIYYQSVRKEVHSFHLFFVSLYTDRFAFILLKGSVFFFTFSFK